MELKFREHLKAYERLSYVKGDGDNAKDHDGSLIDCSLGVNPFGCSNTLKEAWACFDMSVLSRYPDFPYHRLKKDLSEYWSDIARLEDINIKLGSGSMDILEKLNKIFIDKGSKVLGYCPQFTDYMTDVESCGGIFEYTLLMPENNYGFDAGRLLSAMDNEHTLIYIDNPNNPTGQVIPLSAIDHIVKEAARRNICVVVDEAYGDFMEKQESSISLINKYANLAVVRSFSKGFGLAGARVGYMVTGELISGFYSKVESPFTVSALGQYASQLALKDDGFLKNCRNKVTDVKQEIIGALTKIGILETDSRIPIMTLQHPLEHIDLCGEFLKYRVMTEAGKDFVGLGKNSIRLRIPTSAGEITDIIRRMEDCL